jgi:hypothetical protein
VPTRTIRPIENELPEAGVPGDFVTEDLDVEPQRVIEEEEGRGKLDAYTHTINVKSHVNDPLWNGWPRWPTLHLRMPDAGKHVKPKTENKPIESMR